MALEPWQDTGLPAERRAADLVSRMTLEEKLAQLAGVWPGSTATGADVAPMQHEMTGAQGAADAGDAGSAGDAGAAGAAGDGGDAAGPEALLPHGPGHLTRPFGTAPVDPAAGAAALARDQSRIAGANRFGIPALAHEECLTGFTAWGATVFPTPLAWGASFDPGLVRRMAAAIGGSLRSVGVHQGLAPVLDVLRDPRWGRTEETLGEDPYLTATVGAAYVRGLESTGVVATLKHLAGYGASRGARNHAPVSVGPRELADVLLPPFEMAVRDGGARSVMHAYNDVDGVPAAADQRLLTALLREEWGFTGTVVSDYFGVSFLEHTHRVAGSPAEAAALALAAGVDVELPAVHCYGAPLLKAVSSGEVPEALVDRAARRVLRQKCELGLLDGAQRAPAPPDAPAPQDAPASAPDAGRPDLDPPALRALARELAEESVVLLANPSGALPLAPRARITVVGPLADDPAALLGCYSFPRHVGVEHPGVPLGVTVRTPLEALRAELPDAVVTRADGPAAPDLVAGSDLCVAVLGDRAGLFGRGTSGEGCDAADLELPDGQGELLDALLDSASAAGTPVVLVLLTGRPYALGRWADRLAAVVQAFFPGEEGGTALAGVLSGRVNPSGRLPVSVPREPGGQPWTYLAPPLGQANGASSLDPTPLYPFGHGLSYTGWAWEDARCDDAGIPTDGGTTLRVTVRNTGHLRGTEVVQLYLHDPVARCARPVARLIGYARVPLGPGEAAEVSFGFHADLAAYTVEPGRRVVEPGALELRLAASSADSGVRHRIPLTLTGPERVVGHERRMECPVAVGVRERAK
ncbi:glycoside hydrolase family 3 N-terminal domain-containing protein [Streptomyces boncukensis]|uniref:Glycosyl hydrolase n=1 Tax=Streptomyces boncukensis TaxID=2711219 RepID=A0A6G4X2B0_9ACTN|nr:glycoside hydrolase family 3 N-terminal domain-containing protein [Streptomyces boncukensis]NGO70801.1 glycosyl hydrolase [Streptomyces boncukensis]